MTVLPFTGRTTAGRNAVRPPSASDASPRVDGVFSSPGRGQGVFLGTYRIERLLDQYGQLAAAGVFSGELTGPAGERLGLASRRHTAAVEVVDGSNGRYVGLGPLDVNMLGFLVTMNPFVVPVPRDVQAPAPDAAPRHLPTARELLGLVDGVTAPDRPGAGRTGQGR